MNNYRETVEHSREFHSRYPIRSQNVLRFALEAFCLPLEVFLHSRMGVRYFHLPKALLGFAFPFVCMMLVNFGVRLHISFYPWNLGFVRAYPVISLPPSWGAFWDNFCRTYDAFTGLFKNAGWSESADLTTFALLGYAIMTNIRWIEQFWRERYRDVVHPRSSGSPYEIWNPIYYLIYKWNIQSDWVKQLGEPLLCICLAQGLNFWINHQTTLSSEDAAHLQFLAVWLGFGGMLLMLKAFFENRSRYVSEYDRRANECDSDAFEAIGDDDVTRIPLPVTYQPQL